jgi:ligand-binding sensor domain-containing protein/putative methionine-R-sulfoxide reductase with GAF domain
MTGKKLYLPNTSFIFFYMLATGLFASAQQNTRPDNLIFYQLTKQQGLSANLVHTLCTDKNNNLWVGTIEGLNRFNGRTVTQYFRHNNPQLANDNIQGLLCDEQNRVWVRCEDGEATVIDENRRFHNVALRMNGEKLNIRRIIVTKEQGAVLFTKKGFFVFSGNGSITKRDSLTQNDFTFLDIPGMDTLAPGAFVQLEKLDENRYAFTRQQDIHIIHFKERKITARYAHANKWALLQWKPGELLMYDRKTRMLESLHLTSQTISYLFSDIKDQYGKLIGPRVHSVKQLENGNLLMATYRDGIYILNVQLKKLIQYLHRPGDAASPPTNRPVLLHTTADGWVFFGSRYNGVSYFKYGAVIGQQTFFADTKGNSYDGYINSIVQKNKDEYYIGTGTNLLCWNRVTNNTKFVNYSVIDGKPVLNEEGSTILAKDKMERLWFLTSTKGIVVLDKNEKLLKRFAVDTLTPGGIMSNWAEYIVHGNDGWIWIGTQNGVRRVNPVSFELDDLSKTPFHRLQGATCLDIFFDDPGYIWIATTNRGLWKYHIAADTILQLTTKQGLISNRIYAIDKDQSGNLYIGSDKGMQVFFKDGRTKKISTEQGLVNERANILMADKKNRIWIGNVNGIACYNPADSNVKYFDQSYGLSVDEIRPWAYCTATDGELFWGTEGGIEYFYPDNLYNQQPVFNVFVTGFETGKLKEDLTQNIYRRLNRGDNNITFYFSAAGFLPQLRSFFQYKLEGQDKEWIQVVNQNSVRYNSLAPGKYTFKLRASPDNKNWVDAQNELSFFIPPMFYQTWWFKLMASLAALAAIFYFVRSREKRIKQKEAEKTEIQKLRAANYRYQLEIEQVTNFFASSISAHYSLDEMLWDVSKNLIGKLGFEDCMIYIWNDDKTILVQKAGYGQKGSMQNEKDKMSYNIPKGKGIIGAAVEGKQYVLINDTSKDSRYFTADDKIRLSELCVPIMRNDEVKGAINTEHSEKSFYNERHVQILTTIASLLAEKIETIDVQRLTREKEMEVLQLNKDLATSQLTALRSQMNPHFIFNALNSVQQYILQGNITEANRYLSKFSKLQRQVLNQSDQNFIPLDKELEVLTLYLELEQLRFENGFTYKIEVNKNVDTDEIKIPPMIVQPFVENAIWHGLMPKQDNRNLVICFEMSGDEILVCTVTDNGIGRKAAARLKNGNQSEHKSRGLSLVYDRLNILSQQYGKAFKAEVKDLMDSEGLPAGTEVKLFIYTG